MGAERLIDRIGRLKLDEVTRLVRRNRDDVEVSDEGAIQPRVREVGAEDGIPKPPDQPSGHVYGGEAQRGPPERGAVGPDGAWSTRRELLDIRREQFVVEDLGSDGAVAKEPDRGRVRVETHEVLGQSWYLEQKYVPGASELLQRAELSEHNRHGRTIADGQAPQLVGKPRGDLPGDRAAPVVTDEMDWAVTEYGHELGDVFTKGGETVGAEVGGLVAATVAAEIWCDDSILVGERLKLKFPAYGELRKSVKEEHGGAVTAAVPPQLDPRREEGLMLFRARRKLRQMVHAASIAGANGPRAQDGGRPCLASLAVASSLCHAWRMEWTDPSTGIHASTPELPHDEGEVERRLSAATVALAQWREEPLESRAALLHQLATGLQSHRASLAKTMAREMGKPVTQGVLEVDKCAWACRFYAEEGPAMLATATLPHPDVEASLRYDPLGCVLGVMPWNFPLWQVFRFAAPTLMAGNVVMVKHAPCVPGCARAIEALFEEVDAPRGLYTNLFIPEQTVHGLIADSRVAAVSLTGSTRAGRAVASTAGANLKKCVLELGGSDPTVVLSGADLSKAGETIVTSRMANAGQSCIAAKRVIVQKSMHDDLVDALVKEMTTWALEDPQAVTTRIGPMARIDLRDEVARQVASSLSQGARCVLGGRVPDRPGAWYPPTLLTNVGPGMTAFDEEVFGPVVSVTSVEDYGEALALANRTSFGLGACLLGGSEEERVDFTRNIQAGACFLGDFVRSDPRLPFGGVKDSGYGRELGRAGILEFVNHKTVCVFSR